MKSIFLSTLLLCTISLGDGFKESFQKAFLQSIKGLDAIKGSKAESGHNSTITFSDFASAVIMKDESSGVLVLNISEPATEEATAKASLAMWEKEIAALLPVGDYVRSQTYDANVLDYMKTVYDFKSDKMSDKQKRPTIEMGAYVNGTVNGVPTTYNVTIRLLEPYFKNQYSPTMP